MGVLDREYMKSEQEQKNLPRLVVLSEKPHSNKWAMRIIYFLCGLIGSMVVLRLLDQYK